MNGYYYNPSQPTQQQQQQQLGRVHSLPAFPSTSASATTATTQPPKFYIHPGTNKYFPIYPPGPAAGPASVATVNLELGPGKLAPEQMQLGLARRPMTVTGSSPTSHSFFPDVNTTTAITGPSAASLPREEIMKVSYLPVNCLVLINDWNLCL
jgi:hypothetical protein